LATVRLGFVVGCLSGLIGCSGDSRFLNGGPSVGQLKTSLSHLEFENEQLKKRTAKLEQENRSMEDRLVQEQIDNGDLTARLDDARNLLRDRGVDADVKLGSRRRGDDLSDDDDARARTTPAGRVTRPRRRAPFAQISSHPTASPTNSDEVKDVQDDQTEAKPKSSRSRRRRPEDLDKQSSRSGNLEWLPVADADNDSTIQIR
jgi:pyruvate/2-oxoglutarate dehydrogenase complex dihydrolipoamide acyltransferase (E2) component